MTQVRNIIVPKVVPVIKAKRLKAKKRTIMNKLQVILTLVTNCRDAYEMKASYDWLAQFYPD